MSNRFLKTVLKFKVLISSVIAFFVPLTIYISTLEQKLIGGDTSWFAIQVPTMEVLAPTGYPAFSIIGKLFSLLPVKDIVYRLNLMSAFFGAVTILFLFLAINRLVKNEIISLSSSLVFAFLPTFWSVANRFEMDTINSFFIALILFSVFLYKDRKKRKFLYFCFAALGLSLTDHPIALFVMPAFLVYIIIINPRVFRNARTALLSILFFILPLSLYAFIPIRSLQGYGPVLSFKDFVLYLTGRYTSGQIHGGSFFDKDLESILKVTGGFFRIIYINYGIILLAVAVAGLVYLFIKNLKFAICSVLVIIFNLLIISMFINWAPQNQVIDTLLIISVFVAMGFLLILDSVKLLFDRILSRQGRFKTAGKTDISDTSAVQVDISQREDRSSALKRSRTVIIKNIIICVLLIIFLAFPVLLGFLNYEKADSSRVEDIYLFWDKIFNTIEDNSSVYASSTSANIGKYMSLVERPEKNVKFILNRDKEYTIDSILSDIDEGRNVYLVNVEDFLTESLNYEAIFDFLWKRFNDERYKEDIVLFRVLGEKVIPEIGYAIEKDKVEFGEQFTLEYNIINNNPVSIKVTSLELDLPDSVAFEDISDLSMIKDEPSINQGKYMWVKDYFVDAGDKLSVELMLRAARPGKDKILFRITSQNSYFDAEDIDIEVVE